MVQRRDTSCSLYGLALRRASLTEPLGEPASGGLRKGQASGLVLSGAQELQAVAKQRFHKDVAKRVRSLWA